MSPVSKKLHIKPNTNWLFYNAPANYLSVLEPLPEGVMPVFEPDGSFDGIQLFVKNSGELKNGLMVISPLLKADTIFWVTYPKKSSGIPSDLEMMGTWDEPAKYGLRTVSAASIDETWTAIRLKQEGLAKLSEFRNEAVKKSEYSEFIDLENRKIIMPPDMHHVVSKSPAAMTFYETLSFSNKKEYVVWILSAKQEKTRNERLEKLPGKLLGGKKNPSEK
ncbi:YdeI/OmpD-associated family protein [Mucilaginibacter sp.]|uniref:YdeI/OmpD-associated family protein n=1 Tax=Mucilaginibacter sp. TaxID=1882438 RepID=UPI00283E0EF6|nr:YdeI/OmpD-associated family protein [Mucilaginibacter sp.]MDR3695896.1 YdeI/OmpD-associated family protein [Mucilaginibacter sp.]